MRESILTIPINEVFEPRCGCPLCRMRDMLETRTVEYIMGAAMMEPDVRLETNRLGFCKEHFNMMLSQKNRLSLALMLQTHLDEVRTAVFAKKKAFEPKLAKQKKLSAINSTCFVCAKAEWGLERLLHTFFDMYRHADFRALFCEQEFLCLPHYETLCGTAPAYLKKEEIDGFYADCEKLAKGYAEILYADVSKYCSMYDYRNAGKDADWGNSRDSIERAIAFLTSRK